MTRKLGDNYDHYAVTAHQLLNHHHFFKVSQQSRVLREDVRKGKCSSLADSYLGRRKQNYYSPKFNKSIFQREICCECWIHIDLSVPHRGDGDKQTWESL